MKKILLIHWIVAPYRIPFFNELDKKFKSLWYKFKIIFNAKTESNRNWDLDKEIKKQWFEYEILESKQIHIKQNTDNYYFHINIWLSRVLDKENPDIIIHAWWSSFSARKALFWCKKHHKKYILWNESSKYETSRRRTLTMPIVKYLVRRSDWYLSFWTRATEYLIILWANKDKIYQTYNTVDVDFFVGEYERLKDKKDELKKKYWIKTKYVLLYVGQLIKNKWIYEILEWFKNFQKNNSDWSLIFVWWWQEKENMERIIKEQNIKNVYFPWFFQIDKISELYVIWDVFTLPSKSEVWWLVISEAMCFWLPIITGYKVWACVDLVKEWENWFIMKEYTWDEFERGLNKIVERWLIKKNSSRETIKNFNIKKIINYIKF